jgi:PTS system N-acetylglucosamine-specific IIC component
MVAAGSPTAAHGSAAAARVSASAPASGGDSRAARYLAALGGPGNLEPIDACTTRRRLVVRDHDAVDAVALKALGASGAIRASASGLQVVVGPIADKFARETRDAATRVKPVPGSYGATITALRTALSGDGNIVALTVISSRLRITVSNDANVGAAALGASPWRGAVHCGRGLWHVVVGPGPAELAADLR